MSRVESGTIRKPCKCGNRMKSIMFERDGTEFISETVGTPVRDAQGKVVGLLGLVLILM